MVLGISQTPSWLFVLPAFTALVGVFLGQLIPEFFRRRARALERYDTAIAAVSNASAARLGIALKFPSEWLSAPDDATELELSKATVARFLDANAEARSALASLYPWSPDLRSFWDRPFMEDEDFDAVISILTERRKAPSKRHVADRSR
ncbi:MAG TPA: hypothetical protein VHO06_06780 [Polyangia bacterium]|nr:hypothetical protein [Polyangia bacterium]